MLNQWPENSNPKFILSFSGGKDSTLALYHALLQGECVGLIMMLSDEGDHSRSHGVPMSITQKQADSLGFPILSAQSSWDDYEVNYLQLLNDAKSKGAELLVTGDIDVPEHASWHEQIVQKVDLDLYMPLWNRPRREIVEEFVNRGFKAMIVSVNLTMGMTTEDLGKMLTLEMIQNLEDRDIDPCGEAGEFHTLVIDGPIFQSPIEVFPIDIRSNGTNAFLQLTS